MDLDQQVQVHHHDHDHGSHGSHGYDYLPPSPQAPQGSPWTRLSSTSTKLPQPLGTALAPVPANRLQLAYTLDSSTTAVLQQPTSNAASPAKALPQPPQSTFSLSSAAASSSAPSSSPTSVATVLTLSLPPPPPAHPRPPRPPSPGPTYGDKSRCLFPPRTRNPAPLVRPDSNKEQASGYVPAPSQLQIQPPAQSQPRDPTSDRGQGHNCNNKHHQTNPQGNLPSVPRPDSSDCSESSSATSNLDSSTSVSSKDSGAGSWCGHPSDTAAVPPTAKAHAIATATQHVYPPPPPPPPPRPTSLQPRSDGAPSAAPSSSPSMSHPSSLAGPPRQHPHHQHHQPQPPQNGPPPPQQQHQQQQAVNYPPPGAHHYAPGHAPQQYGYPSQGGQPADQYRQSPTGQPPHPLALPSMRSFDQQQQHQQHQHQQHQQQQQQHQQMQHQHQQQHQGQPSHPQHHQHQQQSPYPQVQQHHPQQHHNPYSPQLHMQPGAPMGSTMAPGPHMGYFSIQPQPYMHDPMGMRYGLPPGLYDPRMQLSGGRHKKEIKRRTKTGCLTCRKRRIKCDETHPTCNNCKKSKRECLGYDPIFKQQQTPTVLQPAPNGDVSPSSTTSSTAPSTTPAPYTTHPTPVLTPSEPSSATRDPSDDAAAVKVEACEIERVFANIDPSLNTAADTAGANAHSTTATDFSAQQPGAALELRGGGSPFSFTSSTATFPSPLPLPSPATSTSTSHNPPSASAHAYSILPVKMKVDDIIASAGAAPPETSLMPTPQSVEELTKLYYEIYVPGLCQFFESQWFNFKTEGHNPVSIFLHNRVLINLLGSFLVSLHTVNSDSNHIVYCNHLETRVVWAIAKLAYTIPPGSNMPRDDPLPEDNASEVRNRVYVFESLLNGESLAANPLIPAPNNADVQRRKEYEFWYSLAEFLRLSSFAERQPHLKIMRERLDGRENRDVLYSIAVIRQFGPEYEAGWEKTVTDYLDEEDPLNRLHVATQFIRAEASSTGGTTNVVRQFCQIATWAIIHPGYNAPRKG